MLHFLCGFIVRDSGSKDVFVHISALERSDIGTLGEEQAVVVDLVEGRKGPGAEAMQRCAWSRAGPTQKRA